jgi:hypothetical protein
MGEGNLVGTTRQACLAASTCRRPFNAWHEGFQLKTFPIKMIGFAVGLLLATASLAQAMSDSSYLVAKEKIELDVRMAKSSCIVFSGNAKDICVAQAKGTEMLAEAELDASYKPTPKTHYLASAAKASADFAVANERCDDLSRNTRNACRKEAKAAEISAKADAKAQLRSIEARDLAMKKSANARNGASIKSYEVVKAKCAIYSGNSRQNCLNHAKLIFGKT